jgi:hypothetical protein
MDILEKAIKHYGAENQIMQSVEEMAELIQAISKCIRYKDDVEARQHIAEEIADTLIMISQLIIIFDITEYKATPDIKSCDYNEQLRIAMQEAIKGMKNISEKQNVKEGIINILTAMQRIKTIIGIKTYEIDCYVKYKLERLEKRINNERGMKL